MRSVDSITEEEADWLVHAGQDDLEEKGQTNAYAGTFLA